MNWRDIRCSICKRYAKLNEVITDFDDNLKKVTVDCSRCGIQKAKYPCYEAIMGYGDEKEE